MSEGDSTPAIVLVAVLSNFSTDSSVELRSASTSSPVEVIEPSAGLSVLVSEAESTPAILLVAVSGWFSAPGVAEERSASTTDWGRALGIN